MQAQIATHRRPFGVAVSRSIVMKPGEKGSGEMPCKKWLLLLTVSVVGLLLLVIAPRQAARGERDPTRCAEIAEAQYVAKHGVPPLPRVAFLTTDPARYFQPEELARYRLVPLRTLDALAQAQREGQTFDALMLDPEMFRQVPETWLRQQYRQGVPIIVLNVDYAEVAARLEAPVSEGFDHYDPRYNSTYIVFFSQYEKGNRFSRRTYVEYTHRISFNTFYEGVLLRRLQWAEMGFSPEYLEAIEACLYGGEK